MAELRPVAPSDLSALYHICLVTGDAGKDASALHNDPQLIGHLYSAPYAVLEPEHSLVAVVDDRVVGYLVGTYDTVAFNRRLEDEWWPQLRERYRNAEGMTDADQHRIKAILEPHVTPPELVAAFPAHIHMNLLPEARGQKIGSRLLSRWVEEARAAGVTGIHLGASASNAGGIAFWRQGGFEPKMTIGSTAWFGMTL